MLLLHKHLFYLLVLLLIISHSSLSQKLLPLFSARQTPRVCHSLGFAQHPMRESPYLGRDALLCRRMSCLQSGGSGRAERRHPWSGRTIAPWTCHSGTAVISVGKATSRWV